MRRRDFIKASTMAVSAMALGRRALAASTGFGGTLRIGFAGDSSSAAAHGVQLGIEEAQHAAAMFGGAVALVTGGAAAVRRLVEHDHVTAVIDVAADGAACDATSELGQRRCCIYMNVACADDALRGARCRSFTFHVAASERMLTDARATAHAPATARVEVWDAGLTRFGADTLNDRFRARFQTDMTSAAWAGWFAIKTLWEASLRARSAVSGALVAYLSRETSQFDGHKGAPLSFRVWDHQLRQPLYVDAANGSSNRLIEVPTPHAGESARAALDRIGTMAGESSCRLAS